MDSNLKLHLYHQINTFLTAHLQAITSMLANFLVNLLIIIFITHNASESNLLHNLSSSKPQTSLTTTTQKPSQQQKSRNLHSHLSRKNEYPLTTILFFIFIESNTILSHRIV